MSGGVPAGDVARLQAAWSVMMREFGHVFGNLDDGYYPEVEDMRKAVAAFATPTPPIEGRDADVERDVAYLYEGDDGSRELVFDCNGERAQSLLALGYTETSLFARAALQALGERG